jgi:primosomal protein N' (replication factor Y) (superfamily II helicase)
MYAKVLLLNGFEKELWYAIPEHIRSTLAIGSVVRVPIQRRNESALVIDCIPEPTQSLPFAVKDIHSLEPFPQDPHYTPFITKAANFYLLDPLYFYQRLHHFVKSHDADHDVAISQEPVIPNSDIILTEEQQTIVNYVSPHITTPQFTPTLIHGVTGSGKTEVYKRLITQAITEGKSVFLLLPEVTLALQFEHLLRHQLPNIQIIGFHSASKVSEKKVLWENLIDQKPMLILGVHLPIMLPCANLGLIIVDEEHESGFQEKKHPKINSKEMALLRAQHYAIPIILGSATPSVNSLYNAQRHNWKTFSITKRFSGNFPKIYKVLLSSQSQQRRKTFWVSKELELGIKDCLSRKEQAIIFINRRGYSFFVQCKACGFIFQCPHCSVSLTLHVEHNNQLRCHYCDYKKPLPIACPECKASDKEFIKKGIGTQQVVQIFKELFPSAIIERADLDSTSKKRSWQSTVEQFRDGEIDILIGTQTITKGYHFPKVTLVGILWADLNLHFPLYNASETTLQQLIQVAGRAGRQCANSRVIVQAMHDHPVFDYLDEIRYRTFCEREREARQETFYPPYARLACIELKHNEAKQIDHDAQYLGEELRKYNDQEKLGVIILGPALPLVSRVQNCEIRHIVLKAEKYTSLHKLLTHAHRQQLHSRFFIVMNP